MSDWRQIQARIRKARGSSDPSGQLAALYEHTHDAMVAFELARVYEKSGTQAEAIRWYSLAAEKFRRAQWKQKAEEALARLGAPAGSTPSTGAAETAPESMSNLDSITTEISEEQERSDVNTLPNIPLPEVVFDEPPAAAPQESSEPANSGAAAETPAGRKRKRRGRRGGRGRNKARRPGTAPGAVAGAQEAAASPAPAARERVAESRSAALPAHAAVEVSERRTRELEPTIVDTAAAASTLQLRARSGDPGLASRLAKFDSQLRRLLACSLHSVEEPDTAPAGPGVFLITDTEQTSYYYIEACQTLRVGIGNLLRGGRGSRESANLREKLAEHLGINESRVSKYLKDNCAVRWLQLDEGAPLLAHFAIAILRPIANE